MYAGTDAMAAEVREHKVLEKQTSVLKSILHKLWANKDLTYRKGSDYDTPEHREYALAMYLLMQEALQRWGWELTNKKKRDFVDFNAWIQDELAVGTVCMLPIDRLPVVSL
jgi:hypothetical protein